MTKGISQLPSGRWRWKVQVAGVPASGTCDTEPEARRARLDAELGAPNRRLAHTRPTVQNVLDVWVAGVSHAPSTTNRRAIALAAIPAPFLAAPAADVKPAHVAALWRNMAKAGTGVVTVMKAKQALSQAYQLAVIHEVVTSNPFRIAPPPPHLKTKRVQAPPIDQVRRVLAGNELGRNKDLNVWLRIMATVGARPGEICAITWDRVNFDRGVVTIGPSADREHNITDGKNEIAGWREVSLDLPILAALRKMKRSGQWVFMMNGHPWNPNVVSRTFKRRADALGITWPLYHLRHFAASEALAAGVPVVDVAAMLGDNPATVLSVYGHMIPGRHDPGAAVSARLDAC